MIYLLTRLKKLEVAVSSPIMEDIPVSFSIRVPFLLFFVHVLSLTLSLSLSLSLALLMLHLLLLCSVMSSSLILIINEL